MNQHLDYRANFQGILNSDPEFIFNLFKNNQCYQDNHASYHYLLNCFIQILKNDKQQEKSRENLFLETIKHLQKECSEKNNEIFRLELKELKNKEEINSLKGLLIQNQSQQGNYCCVSTAGSLGQVQHQGQEQSSSSSCGYGSLSSASTVPLTITSNSNQQIPLSSTPKQRPNIHIVPQSFGNLSIIPENITNPHCYRPLQVEKNSQENKFTFWESLTKYPIVEHQNKKQEEMPSFLNQAVVSETNDIENIQKPLMQNDNLEPNLIKTVAKQNKHTCSYRECDYKGRDQHNVLRHEAWVHELQGTSGLPYMCPACNVTVETKQKYVAHRLNKLCPLNKKNKGKFNKTREVIRLNRSHRSLPVIKPVSTTQNSKSVIVSVPTLTTDLGPDPVSSHGSDPGHGTVRNNIKAPKRKKRRLTYFNKFSC